MSLKSSNVIIIPITVNIFDKVNSKFINHILKIYIIGNLINQSIDHIYLLDFIKTFFQNVVLTNMAQNVLRLVYVIQHHVIKFVSDFRQVGGFLWVLRFLPPIKLTATI
jgi:hypothetical protein